MYDLVWNAAKGLASSIFQPARSPARWLNRLGQAVGNLDKLTRSADLLNPFCRPLPLVSLNPLAALAGAVVEPSSASTNGEDQLGGQYSTASTLRLTPSRRSSVEFEPPKRIVPGDSVLSTAIDRQGHRSAWPSPEGPAGSTSLVPPADRQQSHHLLRATSHPRTLSVSQLEALVTGESRQYRGVATPSSGPSGIAGVPPMDPTKGGQPSRQPLLDSIPAAARPAAGSSAGRRTIDPTRLRAYLAAVSHASLPPNLSDSAEAGVGLLSWLAEPRHGSHLVEAKSSIGYDRRNLPEAGLLPVVITRAFRSRVRFSGLSPEQLAASTSFRLHEEGEIGGSDRGPEIESPPPLSVVGEAGQNRLLDQPRRSFAAAPTGPDPLRSTPTGLTLLRQSLSRSRGPSEPGELMPASQVEPSRRDAESQQKFAKNTQDVTTESGPRPVVQNILNMTVHLEGELAGNEQDLAERLTRLLVEQARRHGIDV